MQRNRATQQPAEFIFESGTDSSNPVASGSGIRHEEGTSPTISTQSEPRTGTSIRAYVAEIDHLIDLFRAGEKSKFEVVSSVTQFLNADSELSPQERTQSFELYMAEISSIPEVPTGRGKGKGKAVSIAGFTGAPLPPIDHDKGREPDGGGSSDGDASSSSSSGSESEDGKPARKSRKLHLSDMPWSKRKDVVTPRNPSCVKSADLIRKFHRDLKSTKLFIRLTPGAPRGIPMSEWEHVIKGEAVDLDKILSSLHRVTTDAERKASVGDTEISISSVETKRKVETSSEWSTAWRSASRAIAFVFDHREQELAEYGDYIERLFAAKRPASHGQIILFDRGVRNEVGGGQSLLLTDYQFFTSLYAATLQDDGIEYHRGRGRGGGKSAATKDETCIRFNSQAGCRFSDSACKYKHVCFGCNQSGHGKSNCDKGN